MNIPKLTKAHKIAIFCWILVVIIILFLLATPVGDNSEPTQLDHNTVTTEKEALVETKAPARKKSSEPVVPRKIVKPKPFINNDSEMVSMQQLFAPYKQGSTHKPPHQEVKPIPVKDFAKMISAEIDSFSEADYKIIEMALLNADNLNIGTIGLEFINSKNEKLQLLGFELITRAAIKKPRFFQPNKFYMAFAEKGFAAEPFIREIIESTGDDFCREWACELYVDIFFHNTDKGDSRHQKLSKIKKQEEELLKRVVSLLKEEKKLKKIIAARHSLGGNIRQAWGKEKRYSLKLIEVMKLLDNLNSKNQYPTTQKIVQVINKYNFNYNILNHLDGKPIDLPPIPPEIKLTILANAVFGEKVENTFQWVHKKDGGFTKEEVKVAIAKNNQSQIQHMNKILRLIICAVLRGKLLLGLGNHELEILRYFCFANWDKKPVKWADNLLIIRNLKGKGAPLVLATKPDTEKILTGKGVTASNVIERNEEFYVPPQTSFIWFLPNGDYTLSVNKKNTVYKSADLLQFEDKKLRIKNHNLTIDIY